MPALKAPVDLTPERVAVTLDLPAGAGLEGGGVVEPEPATKEITLVNNR